MSELHRAFEYLKNSKEVQILRVKNRFTKRTDLGWADAQLMLRLLSSPGGKHICEIQLVHRQLMLVRKHMGAHKEYAYSRSASELLARFGEKSPCIEYKTLNLSNLAKKSP